MKITTNNPTEKMSIAFELAHVITEARLYAGLTQEQLAQKVGTKQENISRAESGRVEVKISFLKRIADAVGAELMLPYLTVPDKK